MEHPLKDIFKNWRVIFLLFCIVIAIIAINPNFGAKGVAITYVGDNSSAALAGMKTPNSGAAPRSLEVITSIMGKNIETQQDFYDLINSLNSTDYLDAGVEIVTNKNKQGYYLTPKPLTVIETLTEQEPVLMNVTKEIYSSASDTWVNITVEKEVMVNKTAEKVIGIQDLGIKVKPTPVSNIRKGLDLEGGVRVVLQPEGNVSDDVLDLLIVSMQQRLNVFGLSDITVKKTYEKFIVVEIPGINQEEVEQLISQNGKFEAKIGGKDVFTGDEIKAVLRDAQNAGYDLNSCPARSQDGGYICRFHFGLIVTPKAAESFSRITDGLGVVTIDPNSGMAIPKDMQYLDQKIDFFIDGNPTDSLNINAELKGKAQTSVQITGSGSGANPKEAKDDAMVEMKRLQAVLSSGSLPVTVKVIRANRLSPSLGEEFLKNALLLGICALIGVSIAVFLRYRNLKIVLPMVLVMCSEVLLLMGAGAMLKWSIDLSAIAGVLLVIGTGVDHLIIITDETLAKTAEMISWLEKVKRAFIIIFVAGITGIVAMIPLYYAGAGLLKGFAITTILGILIGVVIARPTFGSIIEIILRD